MWKLMTCGGKFGQCKKRLEPKGEEEQSGDQGPHVFHSCVRVNHSGHDRVDTATWSCQRPPRRLLLMLRPIGLALRGRLSPFARGRIAWLVSLGLLSPLQRGTAAK